MAKRKTQYEIGRAWANSPAGIKAYQEAHKLAQRKADELNTDVGIEVNALFKTFNSFLLPHPENRYGHELSCEVVSPVKPTKGYKGSLGTK